MAGMPGSGGVAHRTPFDLPTKRALAQTLLAPVLAAALLALWLIVDPHTPDLAAQTYRVNLFGQLGFSTWDEHWYAGHDLPGYSLLFPPLASAIGIRLTACICALGSAALFARIAHAVYGAPARWGAAAFAAAAVAEVWIGRLTFALGVSIALAAVLALVRRRLLLALVLAGLCAAASPVAGVLLALAGLTHSLVARRRDSALALALPTVVVAGAMGALFPEGGSEPYPFLSFLATVLVVGAFLVALPAGQPLLRWGARVYLLAAVLSLGLSTPMGANVERYGVLLAGPLLLFAWTRREAAEQASRGWRARAAAWRPGAALVAALALWAAWVLWGPVRETRAVAGEDVTSVPYYAPVERFLHTAGPVRVEVPLTRSHWEAALLAPSVSLARGWEKQLDERFDKVLLEPGLTPASYQRWLREQAISYVALPDAPLDSSSSEEGHLIRAGLSYLREVFTSAHWRVFAVLRPAPILEGPGRLMNLGHDSFALAALARGRFEVRVHYSRYLTVTSGRGCVSPAARGWTTVDARAAGTIVVAARFSPGRALGLEHSCA
jgi:hypothetical protein